MPKNILIFADGTGQAGGVRPDQQLSNIYKLFRATRVGPDSPISPKDQVAYYAPGLGTTTAAGRVRLGIGQRLQSLAGLAVGLGISSNVIDCYEAILRRYEPGDRIYLFGFSRGGYTVRSVANVLNLCGVPTTDGKGGPLPRTGRALRVIAREAVKKVYEHGAGHPRVKFEKQREALGRAFRQKYGAGADPARGDVFPEFIGVFDAVAALGLPLPVRIGVIVSVLAALAVAGSVGGWAANHFLQWSPLIAGGAVSAAGVLAIALAYTRATWRWAPANIRNGERRWHLALWSSKHYDQFLDPRTPHVRHALAIDETREQFGRVKWGGSINGDQAAQGRFKHRWFAGNHSDIGGSYPEEESRLSDISLKWMVDEALALDHPIIVDWNKLHLHPDPLGAQHSEVFAQLQGPWWMRIFKWPNAPRYIQPLAELDPSVLQRFSAAEVTDCDRRTPYRPQSLREHSGVAAYYAAVADAGRPERADG